jgi:hypothetical protein
VTTTILGPLPDGVVSAVSTAANWLVLLCIAPLVYATARYPYDDPRRAHPSPVTWGTWFPVGLVATIGLALGGAPTSAWTIKLFLSLGPGILAVVALYCGERLLATRVDRWSLALGGIGLLLYVLVYFGFIGSPAVFYSVLALAFILALTAGVVLRRGNRQRALTVRKWSLTLSGTAVVIYVLMYFGADDPYAAGLVAVATAIAVDAIGAVPTWVNGWRDGAPPAEILTFGLALVSVVAVLCILPWPWTWLSATYLVFLGLQMISIIAVDVWGRHRAQLHRPAALA